MNLRVVPFLLIILLLVMAGCQSPVEETPPVSVLPITTPEAEPTETPSAIPSYDVNGDGILQTSEFPIPSGEVFGLEGEDAELYTRVAAMVMELSLREYTGNENWMNWITDRNTHLILPHFTVVGNT